MADLTGKFVRTKKQIYFESNGVRITIGKNAKVTPDISVSLLISEELLIEEKDDSQQ